MRTGLFIVGASALPALLPLLARYELRTGANGYGELLGLFGLGGVIGGAFVTRVRSLFSRDNILIGSTIIYAAVMVTLAEVGGTGAAFAAMFVGGSVWVLAMTALNVSAQIVVPRWVRGRALAIYQFTVQGGIALGGVLWGAIASHSSVLMALKVAALFMVLGLAAVLRYRLPESESFALEPVGLIPPPATGEISPDADAGPVMVSIEYEIDPAQAKEFRRAMRVLRTIRLRDGAIFWGLFSDAAKQSRYVEYFMVESWSEHMRQHGRTTDEDTPAYEDARRFHVGSKPPTVSHQIAANGL